MRSEFVERMPSTTYMVAITWSYDQDHTDVATFTFDRQVGEEPLSHEEILRGKRGLPVRWRAYQLLAMMNSQIGGHQSSNRLYEVGDRGMVLFDRGRDKTQLYPLSLKPIGFFRGRRLMEVSRE